ncbi:unnamed protein product [Rhodiola kirilowii]
MTVTLLHPHLRRCRPRLLGATWPTAVRKASSISCEADWSSGVYSIENATP